VRRVAVNVSTGTTYRAFQGRLNQKLNEFGNCDIRLWSEPLPKSWTPHKDVPYRFKAHALRSVDADLILWLDSAILPLRSLDPLWKQIEEVGYFIPANPGMWNYEWTAMSAYDDLFPEISREAAIGLNRRIPHCSSAAFGFNLSLWIGQRAYSEFSRLANTRAFCGPWANSNGPDKDRYQAAFLARDYTTAVCGPPDVRGHRHDQTALSVIAWRLGMKLDTTMYAHENGTPEPGEGVILYHKI
jgi:hypothetical protein